MVTAAERAVDEQRLLAQTQELQARTAALAGVPFERESHDLLNADLRRHQRELAAYRQECHEARRKGDR